MAALKMNKLGGTLLCAHWTDSEKKSGRLSSSSSKAARSVMSHDDMNSANFERYLNERIIPTVPEGSLIIVDKLLTWNLILIVTARYV